MPIFLIFSCFFKQNCGTEKSQRREEEKNQPTGYPDWLTLDRIWILCYTMEERIVPRERSTLDLIDLRALPDN